jgi:hypothetical protein
MDENRQREINEAIEAGERALSSLYQAQEQLNSARGWGVMDMIGGGLLSGLIKHSKMDNAAGYVEQAKRELLSFQKELRDVNMDLNLRLNTGDFLDFADLFFDGFVADYLVQSKINDARIQVDEAISKVNYCLQQLQFPV